VRERQRRSGRDALSRRPILRLGQSVFHIYLHRRVFITPCKAYLARVFVQDISAVEFVNKTVEHCYLVANFLNALFDRVISPCTKVRQHLLLRFLRTEVYLQGRAFVLKQLVNQVILQTAGVSEQELSLVQEYAGLCPESLAETAYFFAVAAEEVNLLLEEFGALQGGQAEGRDAQGD